VNYGNCRGEFFRSLVLLALISAGVPELNSEGVKSIPTLKTTVFPTAQPILKTQPTQNLPGSQYTQFSFTISQRHFRDSP